MHDSTDPTNRTTSRSVLRLGARGNRRDDDKSLRNMMKVPLSDHFDGDRFFNPTLPKGFAPSPLDAIKMARELHSQWPTWVENTGVHRLNEMRAADEIAAITLPTTSSGNHSGLHPVQIPCSRVQIPCFFAKLLSREFRCKPLNLHACRLSKSDQAGGIYKIPC